MSLQQQSGSTQAYRDACSVSQQVCVIAPDQPSVWQAPFNTETQIQHDVHPPPVSPPFLVPPLPSQVSVPLWQTPGFINSVKHHTENVGHKRGWLLSRHLGTAQSPQTAACGAPDLLDRQRRRGGGRHLTLPACGPHWLIKPESIWHENCVNQ